MCKKRGITQATLEMYLDSLIICSELKFMTKYLGLLTILAGNGHRLLIANLEIFDYLLIRHVNLKHIINQMY